MGRAFAAMFAGAALGLRVGRPRDRTVSIGIYLVLFESI